MNRRDILAGMGATALAAGPARAVAQQAWMNSHLPDGTRAEATLQSLPGKQKLICLADRPPNYEAPIETFRAAITPNDQFFVRYHLAGIPPMAALAKYALTVGGDAAERQVTFSLDELERTSPRPRSPRCASAPATAAACPTHMLRAWNGATARWATRSGAARG